MSFLTTSSLAPRVQKYTDQLTRIFQEARDKAEAHRKSGPLLLEMAADTSFISAALESHVQKPDNLNTCHFPAVGINVLKNAYYDLVLNCFLPAPTGETDLTFNSLHHHGDLMLTSAAAFGPGYEHWRFTTPEVVDPEKELFRTRLIDRALHPKGHLAFVDSRMGHAVMYPRALSITVALWSSRSPVTWRDHAKRLPVFKGHEGRLRDLARRLGLTQALDLKVISYFDFYPTAQGFKGMRERAQYQRGTNEDYLFSLFHILQQTGNEAVSRAIEDRLQRDATITSPGVIRNLIGELRRDHPIPYKLTPGIHFGLPHMNFRASQIEAILGPCPASTAA